MGKKTKPTKEHYKLRPFIRFLSVLEESNKRTWKSYIMLFFWIGIFNVVPPRFGYELTFIQVVIISVLINYHLNILITLYDKWKKRRNREIV